MRYNASTSAQAGLRSIDYRALAGFRAALRRFLRASDERARAAGITAHQHQLILALKGHPHRDPPTMGDLAEALQVRPHTVVGLVDRAARAGLLRRVAPSGDRRRVSVVLSSKGDRVLAQITEANRLELTGLRRILGRVSWGRSPARRAGGPA